MNGGSKVVILSLLVVLVASLPAEAHMPGASPPPKFELEPIVIDDGGKIINITLEEVGSYHNEWAKEMRIKMLKKQGKTDEEIKAIIEKEFANATGICPCVVISFRAALLGIKKLWGDEIPKRDDIKIISNLPTPGSCQCFQYITGNAPKMKPAPRTKGEFHIILPNGTEIKNMSPKNLKKVGISNNASYYHFTICRKSTGECFTVDVKDDVFPEDYFVLRKKVKYGVPEKASKEEVDKFRKEWESIRNAFLTKPDWELFEEIEKPEPERNIRGAVTFLSILVGCIILGVIWRYKRGNL